MHDVSLQVLHRKDIAQLLKHIHQLLRRPDVVWAELDGLEVARAGICDKAEMSLILNPFKHFKIMSRSEDAKTKTRKEELSTQEYTR